jgi:hypothetical protein
MLTEERLSKARALLEASRNDESKMDAAIAQMLKDGTAVRFDSVEALMEWLKRPDEIV